jgi:hypothetical protein
VYITTFPSEFLSKYYSAGMQELGTTKLNVEIMLSSKVSEMLSSEVSEFCNYNRKNNFKKTDIPY